ncbi:MAG: xanthine dehydrogenase accessory protein XdhC [Deltaproteobacteria bacterium]|nr:xanthine dehydrogenase accessory protein XdhC [Deltaproteobacteria bacterium]
MEFKDFSDFLKTVEGLDSEGKEFVICTVVDSTGSSPQKAGSKMVVTCDDRCFGTVGGGVVESEVINRAKMMLKEKTPPQVIRFDLNNFDVGVCGGSMSIFLEGIYSNKEVLIFGAGHVAEAVCDILSKLSYRITVFDNRSERLNLPVFKNCERICAEYSDLKNHVKITTNTDILIMTPNHEYDFLVVKEVLKENYGSIGVLGSHKKRLELHEYLKNHGFATNEIDRIRIPVGLDIGSKNPYEIAISIIAELIKMRSRER